MSLFISRLIRRKQLAPTDGEGKDNLERCLTLLDLVALGVGSTLGSGAYVIAGTVAKQSAGPAVIISFLIAAVASVLAGLCYAEFAGRVPAAGSAYIYTYITVGEFLAFIIGWNLILEYLIGAAAIARAFTGYLDNVVGEEIVPWLSATFPIHVPTMAPYFDLLALFITIFCTIILGVGVKESATFSKIFTVLNLLVLLYIVITVFFKHDVHNWALSPAEVPDPVIFNCSSLSSDALAAADGCCTRATGCGDGGFAPYGFGGIMSGAASCFFAFVGFDVIATAGEEAKDPSRSIPIGMIVSLGVVMLVYCGVSVTVTLMAPYYVLDSQAPFAKIFANSGWVASRYIVSIGAVFSLWNCLLGGMFPMPRVILAMARDGLLFRWLGHVNERTKTPLIATLVSGGIAAVLAAALDTKALVDLTSIGTLLAYTLVAFGVLILRYEENADEPPESPRLKRDYGSFNSELQSQSKLSSVIRSKIRPPEATVTTSNIANGLSTILLIGLVILAASIIFLGSQISQATWWSLLVLILGILITLGTLIVIKILPQNSKKLSFAVPFVPFFPAASIFCNFYLMLSLDGLTWARFGVWMLLGFIIYFGYGMWKSSEEDQIKGKLPRRSRLESSEYEPLVDDAKVFR